MRRESIRQAARLIAVLGLVGCGGGGSSSGGSGGSLNFRPVWEQPGGGGAAAAFPGVAMPRGSFGPDLPAAVKTIRIAFASDNGQSCCLGVDPTNLPIDPISGRRFLVMSNLPGGGASVSLAGFAGSFAPADDALSACPTDPPGAGQACDPEHSALPSFESDAKRVNIITGLQNDAGDIPVFAVPFVLGLTPDSGSTATNPVGMTFTVVDAGSGIDRQSVAVQITSGNQTAPNASLTLTACDDGGGTPCSAGGELQVTGFRVVRGAQTLQVGGATAQITAHNLGTPARSLDLRYDFTVAQAPPPGTPLPGQVVIVRPGASIASAARLAPANSTIVVAPGQYAPFALGPGDIEGPMTFLADIDGSRTDSAPAPVTISVRGNSPGIHVSELSNITIDGFSVRGGVGAGVLVERSTAVVVQHCLVTDSRGDGVLIDGSSSTLVLNNLVFNNSGSGIEVVGSIDARLVNNTLYQNRSGGIVVGDAGDPSASVTLRNNIINLNTPGGLSADGSTAGYDADYNLNTDGYAGNTPGGTHDVVGDIANPLFIAPNQEDFHLARGLSGSQSPAVNAGDPGIDEAIVAALAVRTTQTDGSVDDPPIDLGYHYPPVAPTPTPRPRPTRTPTPTRTPAP